MPFAGENCKVMKIAFVVGDITSSGGIERAVSVLSDVFARHGHDVTIVSLFRAHRSPVYPFGDTVRIVFLSDEKYAVAKQGGWRRLCMFVRILPVLRVFFRKSTFDFQLGCGFPVNFALWLLGRQRATVACEHTNYNYYPALVRRFRTYVYRSFFQVVTLTRNDCKKFGEQRLGNVAVIPNPVPFVPSQQSDLSQKRIITVGRLSPEKGYDLLLGVLSEVFERFPDWRLDIFGDGVQKEHLVKLRDDLGLQARVAFRGVTRNIVREYLSSSLYVLSSKHEGFGMVLIEAAACGLPIVSFDCPEGPADILRDDGGILVEPSNAKALREAIERILSDEDMRTYYGAKGPAIARRYDPERIYGLWMDLLRKTSSSR